MKIGAVVVAVGLGACGSGSPRPAPVVAAPPPTCAQAADHMQSLLPDPTGEKAGQLHATLAKRCLADAWAVDVRVCITSTQSLEDPQHCKDKLTQAQREAFEAELVALAHPPPPPEPTPAGLDLDTTGWPQECLNYLDATKAFMRCDKIPQESRNGIEEGVKGIAGSGKFSSMPADQRKSVTEMCKMASDAIQQVTKSMGC